MHCFLKDSISYLVFSAGSAKVEEKLEDGVAIWEGWGHGVFELNNELVSRVKGLEGVAPIVNVEEAFLVWIELREEFLDQRLSQVESR